MMVNRGFGIIGVLAATTLSTSNAFLTRNSDNPTIDNIMSPMMRSNPSRILLDSADDPSLTEDGPLVYRYYEDDFIIALYGLTELLSAPDAQVFQETTKAHLNKRLRDSPVDLRVSSTRVLDQKQVDNDIPILSLTVRFLGQAVSADAEPIATLSFQDVVLDIFAKNPSELSRALKDDSDAFDNLLIPEASVLAYETSGSSDGDLVVLICASVGAALLTAIILMVCLWRQKRDGWNSKAVDDLLKKDEEELGIASTWSSSSSDTSSSKPPPPVTPPKLRTTQPKLRTPPMLLRSFPTQERKALSPCIEELVGVDEGREHEDSSVASSQEGIFSIKNWTYSSSSDESDAESVKISLSMQSIDDFEASIRSTPPRKRRTLLEI